MTFVDLDAPTPSSIGAQPSDGLLSAISALTTTADQLIYAIGADQAALTAFTAFARSLVAATDAAAARSGLGLGSMATQNSGAVAITGGTVSGLNSLGVESNIAGLSRHRILNVNNTAAVSRTSLVLGTGLAANNNGVFIETILNTNGTLDNRPGGPGLPFVFRSVGIDIADYTSARWAFSVPVQLPSYTLATLPIATTAAQSVYCSNLTGGAEYVFSDGTNWRRMSDRTIAN